MSGIIKSFTDCGALQLSIDGQFDFSLFHPFKDAYEKCQEDVSGYIVDFSKTTNIDSSAFGILLLLKDYAKANKAEFKIINMNDSVESSLLNSELLDELMPE